MIQKVSKEKTIDFVEQSMSPNQNTVPKQDVLPQKKETKSIEGAKHLDNKDMITRGSKVMSAASGAITNMGGPTKHMRSESSNSVWDNDVIDKLNKTKDSKERVADQKEETMRFKKGLKENRLDEMVESLKQTDLRKGSSITGMSPHSGGNYKKPQNGISIFDSEEFERIPEKTEGEKIAERAKQPKEKDDSQKSTQQKNIANRSIDKLF